MEKWFVTIICSVLVLSLLSIAQSESNHRNLLQWDTSFETGKTAWMCWSTAYPDNWGIDSQTAFHGKNSLRFSYPVILEAYRFTLEQGHDYTLSCYLKSSKPGAKCTVSIFTRSPDNKDACYGIGNAECSTQWQRFSAKIPAQAFKTDDWRFIVTAADDATFWLDAIQLEEDGLTDYDYQESLSISTNQPGNIYLHGQANTVDISLYNHTTSDLKRSVDYKVLDFDKNVVIHKHETVDLYAGEHRTLGIALPARLNCGFYSMEAVLNDGKNEIYQDKTSFCLVPPTRPLADNTKAFFGTSDYYFETSEELLTALDRIGSKWFNVPLRIGWEQMEPTKGNYNWADMDRQVAFIKNRGFNLVGYLYDFIPKWAASEKNDSIPRDMNEFGDFIYHLVSRYKNDIKYWDLLSEPDLAVKGAWEPDSAKLYADFVRAAYLGAKKADPSCIFVACSVSGGDTSTGYPFTREVLKYLGNDIDGIAPHPYTYPRSFGPGCIAIGPMEFGIRNHLKEALEIANGKHVWVGEFGYDYHCSPDSSYAKDMTAYVAQSLITARSIKQIERFLWFTAYYRYWSNAAESYGIWTDAMKPMPTAAVFANLADLLNTIDDTRQVKVGNSAECYVFKNGKRAIGTVWASSKSQSVLMSVSHKSGLKVLNIVGKDITGSVSHKNGLGIKLNKWPVYIVAENMPMEQLANILSSSEVEDAVSVRADIITPNSSTVRVTLASMINRDLKVDLNLKCSFPIKHPKQSVLVKSGEQKIVDFTFDNTRLTAGKEYNISLNLSSKGRVDKIEKKVSFLGCPNMIGNAIVDGNLSKWTAMKPFCKLGSSSVMPPDAIVHKLWSGEDDLSATIYLAHDANNLYFAAKVRDDKHVNNQSHDLIWKGDAIQIAICGNPSESGINSYASNVAEIGLALTNSGQQAYQWFPKSGDISKDIKYLVKRDRQDTLYEAAIPFSMLPSNDGWQRGKIFSFNIVVLDNDGNSDIPEYWLELAPGIVRSKDQSQFKKVILE